MDPHTTPPAGELSQISTVQGGRFHVRRLLGRGAHGEVFHAYDARLGRDVALKKIVPEKRNDESFRRRFQDEARQAARIKHPAIATVFDYVIEDDDYYLVMELVEGPTLFERLEQGPLALPEFLRFAKQVAEGMAAAGYQRIIHRDIKPANIIFTPDGDVKLVDFGVAKELPPPGADPDDGSIVGTRGYMAPEVYSEGHSDERSEVYSLGVVFFECLAGRLPEGSSRVRTRQESRKKKHALRALDRRIPGRLDRLIAEMIDPDPARRPASAAVVLERLGGVGREREDRWKAATAATLLAAAAAAVLTIPEVRDAVTSLLRSAGIVPPAPRYVQLSLLPFTAVPSDPEGTSIARGLYESVYAILERAGARDSLLEIVPQAEVVGATLLAGGGHGPALSSHYQVTGVLDHEREGWQITLQMNDRVKRRAMQPQVLRIRDGRGVSATSRVTRAVLDMARPQGSETAEWLAEQVVNPDAEVFHMRGLSYLQQYDDPANAGRAAQLFRHAIALDEGFAAAHAGLGLALWRVYENTRDPDSLALARAACERSLALDPKLETGHIGLGRIHLAQGMFEAAVAEFGQAIDRNPASSEAYRSLALTLLEIGDTARAEVEFQRAIGLHPDYWSGYNHLGVFHARRERWEKAAEAFRQVVALAPDNAVGYRNLGGAYTRLGRLDDAIAAHRTSLRLRPSYQAYNNLGTVYQDQDRFADAAKAYRRALQIDDRSYRVWGNYATALKNSRGMDAVTRDAYRNAIERAQAVLDSNPRDATARSRLAEFLAVLGDTARAIRHVDALMEAGVSEPAVLVNMAVACELSRRREQAVNLFGRAIDAGYPWKPLVGSPVFDSLMSDPRIQVRIGDAAPDSEEDG